MQDLRLEKKRTLAFVQSLVVLCIPLIVRHANAEIILFRQTNSIANSRILIDSTADSYLIHNSSFTNLVCVSDFPIQWTYDGEGSPSKVTEYAVRLNDTHVSSTLSFNIRKPPKRSGEDEVYDYVQHTGLYICRAVNDSATNASVFAFFPDSRSPILSNEYTTTPTIKVALDKPENDSNRARARFTIPCVPTNPSSELTLSIQSDIGVVASFSSQKPPQNITYDPRYGFTFDIPLKQYPQLFKGDTDEYTCSNRRSKKKTETKVFFVQEKQTPRVKTIPPERVIYIANSINLTCEASQPVRITELWSQPHHVIDSSTSLETNSTADDDLEETTEITPTDQHIANFYDPHPPIGSSGEFHCVTDDNSSEILHTWATFVVGDEKIRKSGLRYSPKKKEFKCRTQLDEPGYLSYINCVNPSECNINKKCFEKSFRCRGYSDLILNWCSEEPKCKKLIHVPERGRGYLRCLSLETDGIDQIQEFDGTGLLQQPRSKPTHPPQLIIDYSEVTDSDSILNVTLVRSPFEFIAGQRWYITYKEAGAKKTHQVYPETESENVDAVTASFRLPASLAVSAPLELMAKVPQRQSMEWTTVTINGIDEIVIGGTAAPVTTPLSDSSDF